MQSKIERIITIVLSFFSFSFFIVWLVLSSLVSMIGRVDIKYILIAEQRFQIYFQSREVAM